MQIELAAYGWEGTQWSTFYPDEMPPEWRLEYYSNEFSSLVVPAADWAKASIDEASAWLEAVPEGFHFYWEIANAEDASRLLELVSQLTPPVGEHLGGWLFHPGLMLEPVVFDALSKGLVGAAYGERPIPAQQAERLAAQGITLCWQEGMQLNCRGWRLRVMRIRQRPDLRLLRQTVEEQSAAGVEQLLLIVDPGPQTPAPLQELQTFIELVNG